MIAGCGQQHRGKGFESVQFYSRIGGTFGNFPGVINAPSVAIIMSGEDVGIWRWAILSEQGGDTTLGRGLR